MEQAAGISFFIGGREILLHESVLTSFIIVILVTITSIYIKGKIEKADIHERPKGLLHIVEIAVETIDNMIIQNMGKKNIKFAPYMLSLAVFLALANLSGLLGLTPPTSDYNVTLALALVTFVLIHFFAIKSNGFGGYLKGYVEPFAVLTPINILGELANPVSLSFRLFGNIISGALIMSLVYSGLRKISAFLIPIVAWPLHGYFDVFSGLLQTFIFVMLSMVYISSSMGDDEEETDEFTSQVENKENN